ncbi:MAG: PQQ-binding-like beta-propeller repeat protein [Candidatus Micrarchaeota archaeon]
MRYSTFLVLLAVFSSAVAAEWVHYGGSFLRERSSVASPIDVDVVRWMRDYNGESLHNLPNFLVERGDFFYSQSGESIHQCPQTGICHDWVTKFDKMCGSVVWESKPAEGLLFGENRISDLLVIGNRVWVVVYRSTAPPQPYYLVEMDASTGARLNAYALADVGGYLHMLTDGTWIYTVSEGTVNGDPAILAKRFNLNTRTFGWQKTYRNDYGDWATLDPDAFPLLYNNQLIFITDHGHAVIPYIAYGPTRLYALNVNTGDAGWTHDLDYQPSDDSWSLGLFQHQGMLFVNRFIYSPIGGTHKISAHSAADGSLVWGPLEHVAPVGTAQNGVIYTAGTAFGDSAGRTPMRALNALTGAQVWQKNRACYHPTFIDAATDELLCMTSPMGGETVSIVRTNPANGNSIDSNTFSFTIGSPEWRWEMPIMFESGTPMTVFQNGAQLVKLGGNAYVPALTSIVVSPPSATVYIADTQQFTAKCYDQCGIEMSCPSPVTWSVLNGAIGSITQAGLFTGLSPGMTKVRAAIGGIFGEADVTVLAKPACAVCTADSQCSSGRCRTVLLGATKRCAPDATSCVVDLAANCPRPDGWVECINPSTYYTCHVGVWDGPDSCATSSLGCNVPPESPAEHASPPNFCGFELQGFSCSPGIGGGCSPIAPSCTDCGPFVSALTYQSCLSGLPACDTGCGALCNEDSDCAAGACVGNFFRPYSCDGPTCSCSYGAPVCTVGECGAECDAGTPCGSGTCDLASCICVANTAPHADADAAGLGYSGDQFIPVDLDGRVWDDDAGDLIEDAGWHTPNADCTISGQGFIPPLGSASDIQTTAQITCDYGGDKTVVLRAFDGELWGQGTASVVLNGPTPPPPPPPPSATPATQNASIVFLTCPRLTYANETNVTLQCLNESLPCDTGGIMLTGAPNDFYGFVGFGGFIYSVETVLDGEYHLVAYAQGVGTASCTVNRVGLKEVSAPDVSPLLAVLLAPLALLLARKMKGRR